MKIKILIFNYKYLLDNHIDRIINNCNYNKLENKEDDLSNDSKFKNK